MNVTKSSRTLKKNVDKENNSTLVAAGAFIVGAILTSPNSEDKAILEFYKKNYLLISHLWSNKNQMRKYLNLSDEIELMKENKFEKNLRRKILGLNPISQLELYPTVKENYNDSINLFIDGYFRASVISCASSIELILKTINPHLKIFSQLIDEAFKQKRITEKEKNYLHRLRGDRNESAHLITDSVSQEDAKHIILTANRIFKSILKNYLESE